MRKTLTSLVLALVLLTGCEVAESEPTNSQIEDTQEFIVKVVLSNHDEPLQEYELSYKQGESVLELVERSFNVKEDGGFISGIEDLIVDELKQEFLAFLVNGELAQLGAEDTILESGDSITFDIQNWE